MPRGGAKKGERRGGRQKGTPNKLTADARQAVALAFQGVGGVEALTQWAHEHPTEFFTRVWTRTIPEEQKHEIVGEVRHAIVKWGDVEIPI